MVHSKFCLNSTNRQGNQNLTQGDRVIFVRPEACYLSGALGDGGAEL